MSNGTCISYFNLHQERIEVRMIFNRLLLLFLSSFSIGLSNTNAQILNFITFNIGGDYNSNGINRWRNRMPRMIKFVAKTSPDILCLQEAHSNQSADLIKSFPLLGIVEADNKEEKARVVYNPILYRKDKFVMIDSGTFAISEYPDSVGSIGWDAKYPRKASWVNLKVVETGEIVFVINVHLDNIGRNAKVEGIKLIFEKIILLKRSDRIILTGDFNSTDKSKVYEIVSQSGLHDTYLSSPKVKGVNYTFHQYGQKDIGKRNKIDFVFTSKLFETVSVDIPQEKRQNGFYISDHNPVIVKIQFKSI